MARTDEDDFWDLYDSLSPQEQENLLYDQQYQETTEMPWTFGGAMEPELDYGNFDMYGMNSVDIPELTTKGKVDPFDLTQQAKRVNLGQDYGALMLDNILSGMAGPGAYDIDAFQPTYDYGKPLNLPGRKRAGALASRGGYEGFLAHQILNEGMSPAEAEALMWRVIETPDDDPELTDDLRDKKRSILDTLPPPIDTDPIAAALGNRGQSGKPTGRALYDQKLVRDTAQGLANALFEDPEYAYEENGKFYDRTPEEAMIKTPQMEFFDKYGLPYPTARYDDPEYVDKMVTTETGMGPEDRAFEADIYDQEMARVNRDADLLASESKIAGGAYRDLQSAFDKGPMVRDVAARRGLGQDRGVITRSGDQFRQTPRVATNLAGDIVPYSFGKSGRGTEDMMIKNTPSRRGTQQDVKKQRSRAQQKFTATQRATGARNAAEYKDPRLNDVRVGAMMYALAQQGRTPFNDAVALRRQGTRAMGI